MLGLKREMEEVSGKEFEEMEAELITDQLIYYLTAKMKGMSRTIVFLVREKERVRKRGKR